VPAVRESRKPIPGQQQPQQQIMTYPWHVDGLEKSGGGGKSKTLGPVLGPILFHMQIVFINLQQAIVCCHRC